MMKRNSDQNSNNGLLGFTLTEVLIIITLITILAAASLIALNPAEVMKRTRDSQRFQELASIHQSLALLEADQSPIDIGNENTVYVSLPDSSSTCASYSLPSLPDGWSYECTNQENYRNVDGTGWVPADFTQYSPGPPFSALPIDPVNKAEDELYYAYSVGSWHLAANMESERYSSGGDNDQESTTGNFTNSYEIGSDTTIIPVDLFVEDTTSASADSGAWDIANASFVQSIPTKDSAPRSIAWNNDGTKLYEIGSSGTGSDNIYAYNVSTAWDISTAEFSQSVPSQDNSPTDITWNSDGTKMYEIGYDGDKIYEYDVSTAWDISTAEFSSKELIVSNQDSTPFGMAWGNNGAKLYIIGAQNDKIYEYDVSTAWDVSTAGFSNRSIATQDMTPTGIAWNSDGTKLYEAGQNSDKIYEYDVSTAWDVSTASFSQSISTQDANPTDISWKGDGTKLYEVGSGNNQIYQYDVSN